MPDVPGNAPAQPAPGTPPGRANPAALVVADAAHLLARISGESITESMLRTDIDAGAPVNADGTVNLIHFTAWLVSKVEEAEHGT
jgi:hypothetical protein